MNKAQLAELISIAKTKDGRTSNKGRPKKGIPTEQKEIASQMRQRGCSVSGIYRALKVKNLTHYKTEAAFRQAWNNR